MRFPSIVASLLLVGALHASAAGSVWHYASFVDPIIGTTMRDPMYEAADNDLVIYQAFLKLAGGNQTGGEVIWRSVSRSGDVGVWNSEDLVLHLNWPSDFDVQRQFWKATIPTTSVDPTDIIQYYIKVTFNSPGDETAYLYGSDSYSGSETTEAYAQLDPYSLRNRPGWIYHANNRIIVGDDIQLRVKTGYIGPDNDPATRWADAGAIYYTTDGSDPVGYFGTAYGPTTSAVPLVFDGTEGDDSGNGNAAWWRATLPGVLGGLPPGAEVKYKVSLWNWATLEEKLGDHGAGEGFQTFVYQVTGMEAEFRITAIRRVDGDVEVDVGTVAGQFYQLDWSGAPAGEVWTPTGPLVEAGGPSTTLEDSGGAGFGRRFYRVRIVADPP